MEICVTCFTQIDCLFRLAAVLPCNIVMSTPCRAHRNRLTRYVSVHAQCTCHAVGIPGAVLCVAPLQDTMVLSRPISTCPTHVKGVPPPDGAAQLLSKHSALVRHPRVAAGGIPAKELVITRLFRNNSPRLRDEFVLQKGHFWGRPPSSVKLGRWRQRLNALSF